jgi:DNA invertase Pin-like site-specific DNA recombinase
MNTKKDIKYFIYARKSTESDDKQMASIEDQIAEATKLAKQLNLDVVDIISESKSAKEPGRKGFNEMIASIRNNEAQGILSWKLNRLARNPINGGIVIDLLQKNIVKHIQTYGKEYLPTDNVIMVYIEFGMSNQFSNDLSVDVKRGI